MKKMNIYKSIYNKRKLVLIAMPIATTILLNGCSFAADGNKALYTTTNSNSSYINEQEITKDTEEITSDTEELVDNNEDVIINTEHLNIPLKNIKEMGLNDIKINFNNTQYIQFNEYLDTLEIYYDYTDLYDFDTSISEYNKLKLVDSHTGKLSNITSQELYNVIKNNNEEYKKNNKTSIYKELDSREAKDVCDLIVNTVNDYISEHEDISVDRLKCVLSDLKLFEQKSAMSNAFVTNDNCLVVSPNMKKIANILNGENTDKDILIHEINHLLQKGCNCDLKNNPNLERNFGICYGFEDIKVDSLDFTWIYEASAEKSMVNYTNHNPFVYENMISYLESLSMVNLLNNNYKVNDTENLCFKRTLDDLYKYFEVTTEKDKREILNLMYSIEVMQQAPIDFYEALENKTGRKKDNILIDEVNYTVKVSICETLTKLFYRNLSNSIINADVTLHDIYYLISLFENDINNHILYNDSTKYDYNDRFIDTYISIQDNFFYQLSKSLNCSQEEIENNFNEYTSKIKSRDGNIINNYNLNFLDEEKIEYLKERENALNTEAASTIRNVENEFSKNNLQKMY